MGGQPAQLLPNCNPGLDRSIFMPFHRLGIGKGSQVITIFQLVTYGAVHRSSNPGSGEDLKGGLTSWVEPSEG